MERCLGEKLVMLLILHVAVVKTCHPGCHCEVESFGLFNSFSLTKVVCSGLGPNLVPVAIPLDTSSLDLSSNGIHSIEDSVLSGPGYTTLSSLDLSNNLISVVNGSMFSKLRYLETLDLSQNSVGVLIDGCFSDLPLADVDLSYNQICEVNLDVFSIRNHGRPLNVDLSNNLLTAITSNPHSQHPNIQSLNLAGNQLSSVPELQVVSLRSLNLSKNPISVIGKQSFAGLEDLVHLFLSEMPKLHKIEAQSFQNLQNLQVLDLSHNSRLKSLSAGVFSGLKLLQELNLSKSGIATLPNNILQLLPSIKSIALRDEVNCWRVHKHERFHRHVGQSNTVEVMTCDVTGVVL
ncbi:tsukushin-like [Astyanax mexicanus]|uniref:Tsukushin-like n=1 Tax=Astyanax mexicanus TaxID=7994 RepID=A0A8T2KWH0_ASTMX|nr:tsukushin-like [Astyanax mexicanus]